MVNTSNAAYHLKPHCSVYARPEGGCKKEGLNFSRVDFVIEFKSGPNPFVDNGPFECPPGRSHEVLGLLSAYATAVLSTQYRTHTFMVFIVNNYARLIRWDRSSGALVTERIFSTGNEQSFLLDFFIRYDIASPEARGHDCTVGLPTQVEIQNAKAIVPELKEAKSLLAFEHSGNRYIIDSPNPASGSRLRIPVGRCTRPSIAYDTQNRRRVLLKDSWRVVLKDIEPEGNIYRRLLGARVPNIPSLLSDGDVGNDSDEYHRSQTDKALQLVFTTA